MLAKKPKSVVTLAGSPITARHRLSKGDWLNWIHSVGVARQYCGQLGKQDNCQIAVSLSVANEHASLPIAFRLYLPEDWALKGIARPADRIPKAS
jgi:hypothetical protein